MGLNRKAKAVTLAIMDRAVRALLPDNSPEGDFLLDDCPGDNLAITALWEENREAIESEMNSHLHWSPDSNFLERILCGLVSQAKYFCDAVDDPKVWVARCANLEARRLALQLRK
jgi:hypothetical protein